MYKIIIKGLSLVRYYLNGARIEYSDDFESLDGISCNDCFSDYFGDSEKSLIEKGVSEGYMKFVYNKDDDLLYTITEYKSDNKLNEKELEILTNYTKGQWSDGIGESFEQVASARIGNINVYISPWFYGQKQSVIQEII